MLIDDEGRPLRKEAKPRKVLGGPKAPRAEPVGNPVVPRRPKSGGDRAVPMPRMLRGSETSLTSLANREMKAKYGDQSQKEFIKLPKKEQKRRQKESASRYEAILRRISST